MGPDLCLVPLVTIFQVMEEALRKILRIIVGTLALCGCAKVSHLDQLLTLKGVADEQTQIGKFVDEQDRKFDTMVAEAKAGTLDQYGSKQKIVRTFGEPVHVQNVMENNRELEACLYRYSTEFFDTDKVYIYFDADGSLVRSEYWENKDGKIK